MPRLRPFQPDDLYLLRITGDPQLSPDGAQIAYVVGRYDPEADEAQTAIWVAAVDGKTPPRQFSTGIHDHSPRWSPDGTALLFVGDRGAGAQLLLAPLTGGEPRALTTLKHGASQPTWSPTGDRIAFVSRTGVTGTPDGASVAEKRAPRVITSLRWRFDGIGVLSGRAHIFVVDVPSPPAPEAKQLSGATTQVTRGDWDDDGPAWSPDGTQLAFVSDRRRQRHDEQLRSDLWVVAATGGRARRVTAAKGFAAMPLWSPDGASIAYLGSDQGDEFWAKPAELLVVDAKKAGATPRSVASGMARLGVPEGPALAWSPEGDALFTVRVERGTGVVRRFTLDGNEPARSGGKTAQLVIGGDRRVGAFTFSADRTRIAYVATWVGDPSEIYAARFSPRSNKVSGERMVSDANREMREQVALAGVTRMTSRAPDGLESESFIVVSPASRKAAARKTRLPLVLDIHGGPHGWHPGTFTTTWAITQTLAGAGYAVLLCNPRGSSGYGDEFLAGCVGDWGGGDFDDLMAAVDAVVEDGLADPKQLNVWGYSYGGFMTSWVVGHTRRFRAAVVGAPVINQVSMIGTTDIPRFSAYELGGFPWERPEEYAKRSPLTYAPDIRTPVLLLHQDGDLRCPVGQSDELFAALKMLGREVEYVRYPGGFHALGVPPSHLIDRVSRTVEWFKRHA